MICPRPLHAAPEEISKNEGKRYANKGIFVHPQHRFHAQVIEGHQEGAKPIFAIDAVGESAENDEIDDIPGVDMC